MRNQRSIDIFFNRDRKVLYIVLSVVIIFIFTLTIVYAALSTTLNINGNAEISAASWDIYLDNVQLNSQSVTTSVPTISNKTTASFSTVLSKPGDFYEFTIDVVNNGSIDAMIDSVTKSPTLTASQAKYLNYIVEYQNGEAISTKQLVSKNSFVRLKVRVEFRNDISASDLPTSSQTLNLSFKVSYVQSDDSGTGVTGGGKIIKIVSGDLNTVGSFVSMGDYNFYLVSSDEDNVILLYESFDPPVKIFKDAEWWSDYVDTYPAYVYYMDNGFFSYDYFNKRLKDLGIYSGEARAISIEELVSLGCSLENLNCYGAPEWVYSVNYFTGSAYDESNLLAVRSDGRIIRSNTDSVGMGASGSYRPVVVIPRSLF